jgi:DNA-binding IclR family transcriptional regulator
MRTAEHPSTSVARAAAILDAVGMRASGMTNAELSRTLQIPKSSASYILRALERSGYLRKERTKYKIGLKLLNLRHSALASLDVREIAHPHLRALVEATGQTGHVAILDGGEAVYVEKADAPSFIKMDTWIGRRMDIHSTSVGKAIAAYLPEEQLRAIVAEHPLRRHTEFTITTFTGFVAELQKVRRNGYALDDEENTLGLRCIAAPIFGADGSVQASIGVSGIVTQVTPMEVPRIADRICEEARQISRKLGYIESRLRVAG